MTPLTLSNPVLRSQSPTPMLVAAPAPAPRRSLVSITILAWAVRLAAVINLIAFTQHHQSRIIYWLSAWMPFEISAGRRVLMLLTALLLFILSSGLERGKRLAWLLTIIALVFAPLIHFGYAVIWPQILLNLLLISLLIVHHRYFVAQSDRESIRSALILCPILLVCLMVVGTVRLHDLRDETSGPDSWIGCLQAACELVLVQNAHTQAPQTAETAHLFAQMRIAGTLIALIAVYLTLRPVLIAPGASQEHRDLAARIVGEFEQDPMHSYALLGDKNFFFNSTRQAVIPYAISGRFAVALADPLGPAHAQRQAIPEFADFCRRHDWVPLFYEIPGDLVSVYRNGGFSVLKIGEDARLDPRRFDLRGRLFQNLRTLCNKARREGIQFRWKEAGSEGDEDLNRQLLSISQQWLERKKGAEMTFDMGTFSLPEIRRRGTGVALDAEGRALAFATWRNFGEGTGRALDLMRSLPGTRNLLDFVLVQSILHFKADGVVRDLSLGNAPLANADPHASPSSVEDHVVRFIYKNLNQVYAYRPLFEFKRKYRPQWRARYLAYPTGESLPLIGLALVRVHAPWGPWKFLTG
jgi:phosphatidylglycerol lysyltransferase